MGFELDCETGDSTIASFCGCFGCEEADFTDALKSIDIEELYSDSDTMPEESSEEYLLNYIVEKFGEPGESDSICWFHLTRTLSDNEFSEGVLPLSQAKDFIWETLFSIFEGTVIEQRLRSMKESGVDDGAYNLKIDDPVHSGPYGILVLDTAFHSEEIGQHDYLAFPEIIEDICTGYWTQYDEKIYDEVEDALSPCVIKFQEDAVADQGAIEAALYFAYRYANGLDVSGASICCYDGKDEAVSYEDILSIDFLEED